MKISIIFAIVAMLALIGAGIFYGFEYVKQKPPDALVDALTAMPPPPPLPQSERAPLIVPEDFIATIFSRDVPGARVILFDPKGTLLVSLSKEGKVVALPDLDQDGQADETVTVLEGLREPHGLYIRCPDTGNTSADQDACVLYVAETDAVRTYAYDADTYAATVQETVAELPNGQGHSTRTLLPHPDGQRLLVSVGSSCNVCNETDDRRASVLAIDLDTHEISVFASGLRNTVFMALHEETGEIWGTDNGRDLIGDDIPPDEINILKKGNNYGWPLCYGKNVYDADFDGDAAGQCSGFTPSHINLQAHSAALGLTFMKGTHSSQFQDDLLVAFHGSWNRSEPTGYKVIRIPLTAEGEQEGQPVDFLTGFLPEDAVDTDDAIGRPVGILIGEDGGVYVSDDRAGAIYRIVRS